MVSLRRALIFFATTIVGVTVGCNSSDFDIVPVSGTLTFNGEPLANARVAFNPRATGENMRAGPDSYAKSDANGRFELETIDGFKGAVVAKHRVRIRTRQEKEGPDGEVVVVTKEKLPARYHKDTELSFQVPSGGTDSADFKLLSE